MFRKHCPKVDLGFSNIFVQNKKMMKEEDVKEWAGEGERKRKRKITPRDIVEKTDSWALPSASHLSGMKTPSLCF